MVSQMATPPVSTEAPDVLAFLGGRKTLGLAPRDQADYVGMVRTGLPYESLRAVASELALSLKDVQSALQLSPRSLQRRKAARLTSVESERVLRLARVAAHASYVLGSRNAALQWLSRSNRALGGEIPLRLLDTDVGAAEVMEVLDRALYGVYT
jgi:putative toxin-antitoxin system antitoxin component (TIGR02293 family)